LAETLSQSLKAHTFVEREPITLAPTVGHDLGKGGPHSGSRWFHGKDGVVGPIPVEDSTQKHRCRPESDASSAACTGAGPP
jgi:hypothetical protein